MFGEPERAAGLLVEALSLWRGSVLDDLGPPEFATTEAARLEELRLVALSHRVDADLALGKHHEVIAELERLVVAHPFREPLHCQLMLALYRSGRQADALAVSSSVRRRLAAELGVDPGPALRELETAILRHDPALLLAGEGVDEMAMPAVPPGALTKYRPAKPARSLVTRARLIDTLRAGDRRRLMAIHGPAGFGKTTLAAQWREVLVGRGRHRRLADHRQRRQQCRVVPCAPDRGGAQRAAHAGRGSSAGARGTRRGGRAPRADIADQRDP